MALILRILRGLVRGLWGLLRSAMVVVMGGMSLLLLIGLAIGLFAEERVIVPDGAVLNLEFSGAIVEQATEIDPFSLLSGGALPDEMLLGDILDGLEAAGGDRRVALVTLRLGRLLDAGPASLHRIADALDQLRAKGKVVLAYGDVITQGEYLLAAHADEVYLNPAGLVELRGYGVYPNHYAAALEKLKINVHVFKVGTFKSAVEPFIRDDMSAAARTANAGFLTDLWQAYVDGVAAGREPRGVDLSGDFVEAPQWLRDNDGDLAQMARSLHLVDGLVSRDGFDDLVAEKLGKATDDDYDVVDLDTYLAARRKLLSIVRAENPGAPKIALIEAVGEIIDGEQLDGTIGGDSLSDLIDRARADDRVKAIVLRIDSPGGSAFASELIRRKLEQAQEDGIKVVASMGSVAASGGYWIAATADQIWAAPTSITGSIGIFGIIPTFERSLDAIGVHSDGIGTTALAGQFGLTRPLGPQAQDIIQQSIENGYRKFITLVANGRRMAPEAVDQIAQGRVWSGAAAHRLGLVDHLGGKEDAIKAAAALAGLDRYHLAPITRPRSNQEKLLRLLLDSPARAFAQSRAPTEVERWFAMTRQTLARLSDPRGVYALCLECRIGP